MKKALLLLLASLALPAAADDAPRYNQVALDAQAVESVDNYTLHVTLNTFGEHRDAAQLAAQINGDMQWALERVRQHPEIRSGTGSYRTWPLTHSESRKTTGWRGQQTLTLESRDSKLLADVVGELQARLKVESMRFTVSDERRNDVENRLINNALDAFKARARIVVANLGARDYRIVSINVGNAYVPPPVVRQSRMAMATMEAAPVAVESGESEITVNVSGTIELVLP